MGIMRLLRKPLRCEAGLASLTPSSLSLDAQAVELTLEGADEVAPEPGLLGEGGVVGVEVEVHLAHSGVASAHPEMRGRLTQTSSSFPGISKKHGTGKKFSQAPNRSSQTDGHLQYRVIHQL